MRLLALLLLLSALVVQAQDARLNAIHSLLVPMRTGTEGLGLKTRGATPPLTAVKHQLRDWIESRLSDLKWDGVRWNPDPVVLQEQLNDELSRAELFCGSRSTIRCPDWSDLGFLGPVALDMKWGLLVVKTAVGIQSCGDDQSAYAYELSGNQWHRFWQSEQNDYEEGKYFPQTFEQVLISPADYRPNADRTEHLILTLGVEPWCSSNWHPVYYRVWQAKAAYREPVLLVDENEMAFRDMPVMGSVSSSDVLMEYYVDSVEGGYRRPEIRHYLVKQGKLERADPVALGPRDFTAFWLRHPWQESSLWTEQESRSRLERWRQQHKGPFEEFGFPTLHCKQQPDLWQVGTSAGEDLKEHVYFLMRWRPPYHFTMVSVGDLPRPDCTEVDRDADEPRSLFPVQ